LPPPICRDATAGHSIPTHPAQIIQPLRIRRDAPVDLLAGTIIHGDEVETGLFDLLHLRFRQDVVILRFEMMIPVGQDRPTPAPGSLGVDVAIVPALLPQDLIPPQAATQPTQVVRAAAAWAPVAEGK